MEAATLLPLSPPTYTSKIRAAPVSLLLSILWKSHSWDDLSEKVSSKSLASKLVKNLPSLGQVRVVFEIFIILKFTLAIFQRNE